MSDHTISAFTKGVQSILNPELIDADAAQDSLGWLTKEGKLILSYGRNIVGNDSTTAGKIWGLWFGYCSNGTRVMYKKTNTKIQYLNGTTWTDVITGLTSGSDYTATNYSSLAGSFTFFGGVDGIWKINNANPSTAINMLDSTKNWGGYILIDRGRMLLWNRFQDKTGIYGSYIDAQGANYTSVTGESTSTSGTLAFASSHPTRNCFGVTITITTGGEVYTDNLMGVLVGNMGGAPGTINYATGAYTIRSSGTAAYQWEDSNIHGVTDFTHSGPRLAGEGFQFPQDIGGDAILNVLIGLDGEYYSIKSHSSYVLTLDDTDLAATNIVYRSDIGLPSFRAAISTNKGVTFMNTANPLKPEMTILQKSLVTNNVEPVILFPSFKFANYDFSDCDINTWERYVTILCKKQLSLSNDTILLCDMAAGTVDPVQYSGRCSAKDSGNFYVGHPLVENVYQLFNGFDDDGVSINNYWISKDDQYQMATGFQRTLRYQIGERLKKYRRQKIKGMIGIEQQIQVYVSCDNAGFQLVGTVLGTGSYVDYTSPQSIGGNAIGNSQIGGNDSATVAYPFFTELKTKIPYFRKRTIMIIATGIGWAEIDFLSDWDVIVGVMKLPTRFRQKQNVSLDGLTDNIPEN